MKNYENEMKKVLHALHTSNALQHCVVSGSWAMYFYEKIFNDFMPRVETTDLDLYLPNPKKAKGTNLLENFKAISYIKNTDYLTGKTMFLSDSGFSIEFLTIPDRSMSSTINVTGLSIVAEALPKMAPAGWNYLQIEFEGMQVNVVSPVSFVLQKLLIHNERNSEFKQAKDLDAIKYVLSFIKASNKYTTELKESLAQYPKKWKKTILENANQCGVDL